jgi:hypothetical protein
MTERMEERHKFPDELRHFYRFLHPFRVQEWPFHELVQDVEIPLRMVLRQHDLSLKKRGLKGLVIHRHPYLELDVFNLPLPTSYRVLARVCPSDSQSQNKDSKPTSRESGHTVVDCISK